MKTFSNMKLWLLCSSVVWMGLLLTPTASAVQNKELLRVQHNTSFQGLCCFSFQEAVQMSEPTTLVPLIVTWSTDYQATGFFFVALSVNGGPCIFFGSGGLQPFEDAGGDADSHTFQWLILPGDGVLRPGKNTFALCGGAAFSANDTIVLGFNTLAVRTSK